MYNPVICACNSVVGLAQKPLFIVVIGTGLHKTHGYFESH